MYFPQSIDPDDITHHINAELKRINREFRSSGINHRRWPVPPIQTENDLGEEFDYDDIAHILTSKVRLHYFTFLQNLLQSNYRCCARIRENSETIIQKCAKILEEKAIRSCMIVSLYRQSMLTIISKIRDDTSRTHLNDCIAEEIIRQDLIPKSGPVDTGSQTESELLKTNIFVEEQQKSLDEKIQMFEKKMKDEERKRKQFSYFLSKKQREVGHRMAKKSRTSPSIVAGTHPESMQPPPFMPTALTASQFKHVATDMEDDITKELHKIFGTKPPDPVEEIFGECSTNTQNETILSNVIHATSSNSVELFQSPPVLPNLGPLSEMVDPEPNYSEELYTSIWPCELHHQRLYLQETLEMVCEKGWRHTEKVKRRFVLLFGEDDDDPFGPYSPSLAVNDILMASCKKRIAPWIVNALSGPKDDGLIANRYLFKKVAKSIAESIIGENQYPDEQEVQQAVTDFFFLHPKVESLEDIFK